METLKSCPFEEPVGKYEIKNDKSMTDQEYIQTCNMEQLAEVLGKIAKNAYQCGQDGKTNKCVNRHNCTGYCDYGWGEWLKQPHREE
jgi:hypothetical protein